MGKLNICRRRRWKEDKVVRERSESNGENPLNSTYECEEKPLEVEKIEEMTSIFYNLILTVCEENSVSEALPRLSSPISPSFTQISHRLDVSTQDLISHIVHFTTPIRET